MVLTMLCCGLRPIEIRRMKWDWIDFDNAILTVGKSKTEAGMDDNAFYQSWKNFVKKWT